MENMAPAPLSTAPAGSPIQHSKSWDVLCGRECLPFTSLAEMQLA